VAGAGTSADSILQLAGVDNAATGVNGFKPVSDEQLTEFAPDVVVMMRRGTTDDHNASQALSLAGLSQSPAAKTKSLVAMDGLYLLGFGPRAPAAARDLMKAVYAGGGHTAAAP
jgi:iron complex transport system substrate-binding protein